MALIILIPCTVVTTVDLHLVTDTIFTLPVTPRPTPILTHSLDTPTVHHLATVIAAPSPNHSWQEALIFNQMKLKYFMKLLEANVSNQA